MLRNRRFWTALGVVALLVAVHAYGGSDWPLLAGALAAVALAIAMTQLSVSLLRWRSSAVWIPLLIACVLLASAGIWDVRNALHAQLELLLALVGLIVAWIGLGYMIGVYPKKKSGHFSGANQPPPDRRGGG
jgi:uncharacterized membrane protein YgaE (UPF0421/DUF939 family)